MSHITHFLFVLPRGDPWEQTAGIDRYQRDFSCSVTLMSCECKLQLVWRTSAESCWFSVSESKQNYAFMFSFCKYLC